MLEGRHIVVGGRCVGGRCFMKREVLFGVGLLYEDEKLCAEGNVSDEKCFREGGYLV